MTAQLPTQQARSMPGDVALLVGGLALASAVELAILRTVTRSAIHIPALEALQEPYRLLTTAGEYAYFVTIALLAPVLVALAVQLFRVQTPSRHLAAFGIILFAIPTGVAIAGGESRLALDAAAIGSVAILGVAFAVVRSRAAIPVLCFAAAFATSGFHGVIPQLQEIGVTMSQPTALLNASEWLGVSFALTLPLMLDFQAGRKDWIVGISVGVLVFAIFAGNGSTSRFLLLWNVGLSGILPSVFYAAAAGSIAITALALARRGRLLTAAGLLLLVTGGIGLHSTYQTALVVAGLATLCCAQWQRMSQASNPDLATS